MIQLREYKIYTILYTIEHRVITHDSLGDQVVTNEFALRKNALRIVARSQAVAIAWLMERLLPENVPESLVRNLQITEVSHQPIDAFIIEAMG